MHIDINCDMGEIPEHISDGTQESLMRSITSVNIACGGHAGDERMMKTTIEQALRWDPDHRRPHSRLPRPRKFLAGVELDLPAGARSKKAFTGASIARPSSGDERPR